MSVAEAHLRRLCVRQPQDLVQDFDAWLAELSGPTIIEVAGSEAGRRRVVCTLLHGNELSGARALHRWLRHAPRPRVDVLCIVASVQTALTPPRYSFRQLPGARDLNRCFAPPFDRDAAGGLAGSLLEAVCKFKPEALVDLHNTSGSSPPYAIVTRLDAASERLARCFAQQLIVTDLRLGTLVEAVEDLCPAASIECGRSGDPAADEVAYRGLLRFVEDTSLPQTRSEAEALAILRHPVRVELTAGARLTLSESADPQADLTLHPGIERHNFGVLEAGVALGWLGPRGLDVLIAIRHQQNIARALFGEMEGRLVTLHPLRLLMVTTRVDIALSDCLFYAVLDHEHPPSLAAGASTLA